MIRVTKEQMKALRKRYPDIQATRTVHGYYVGEYTRVIAFLKNACGRKVEHHEA